MENWVESILQNATTYMFFVATVFMITKHNLVCGIQIVVFSFLFMYLFHYWSHCDVCFPFNVVHLYHHSHNNIHSHVSQIILEFLAGTGMVALVYLFDTVFFNQQTYPIGLVFFMWFFYTTVHNVNYSYFHVNRIHEYHHQNHFYNLGPDLCDHLFGTKAVESENVDHYKWNILVSYGLFAVAEYLGRKYPPLQATFKHVFLGVYGIAYCVFMVYSFYFLVCDDKMWKRFEDRFMLMNHQKFITNIKNVILSLQDKLPVCLPVEDTDTFKKKCV